MYAFVNFGKLSLAGSYLDKIFIAAAPVPGHIHAAGLRAGK